MTNLKNLGARATKKFIAHLDEHLNRINWRGTRADYILNAVIERMKSEIDAPVPPPKADWGVRSDTRPIKWRSRLYRDRYQIVAVALNKADGWRFSHLHETDLPAHSFRGTIRAETPYPVEVSVYCPDTWIKSEIQQSIGLELHTPDWEHLWDRD